MIPQIRYDTETSISAIRYAVSVKCFSEASVVIGTRWDLIICGAAVSGDCYFSILEAGILISDQSFMPIIAL